MTSQTRGILTGLAAGLVIAWLAGSAHLEEFVRVTGGGQYLLDARVDESALGRIINIPAASLGEASLLKRSWIVATSYMFTLQVRPEIAPEPGHAISGLQVNVRLPGRVIATNATRATAGTATWDALPPDALYLRTLAVHWGRVLILVAVLAVGLGAGRTSAPSNSVRRS